VAEALGMAPGVSAQVEVQGKLADDVDGAWAQLGDLRSQRGVGHSPAD
jgi:hypothetical protein